LASAGTRVALALAVLLAAASCSPPADVGGAPDVSAVLRIEPSPPVTGPARLELVLSDAAGRPVPAESVSLQANMSHPGMVPVEAEARATGPGAWSAELSFSMAGDWFVIVDATLQDGRSLERRIDVPGARRP